MWDYGHGKTQQLGKLGEDIAVRYLEKRGYSLLDRNVWKPYGEIDIIARKGEAIHYIEVKSVSCEITEKGISTGSGISPADNMTPRKLKKLATAVQLHAIEQNTANWQIDLLSVYVDAQRRIARCEHLERVL